MKKTVVQQVKRHRKKPSVTVSVSLIKTLLKKAKIKEVQGTVYNFYSCGHVFAREDDKRTVKCSKNNKGQNRAQRICPICWENLGKKEQLIFKYKKCTSCGAVHIGKKLQESICCNRCSAARKAKKGEDPDWEIYSNGHLADPTRCFCIHRRKCIIKYDKYDTLPCKNCKQFKEKEGQWY